jgi:Hemopexin
MRCCPDIHGRPRLPLRWAAVVAVLSMIAICPGPSFAQEWKTVTSQADGFSAEFPDAPEQINEAGDKPGLISDRRWLFERGQNLWAIGVLQYNHKLDGEQHLTRVVNILKTDCTPGDDRRLAYPGGFSADVTLSCQGGRVMRARVYVQEDRLYQVWAIGPGSLENTGDAKRFFDSFKLFPAVARAENAASLYVPAAVLWPGDKAQFFLSDGTYLRYDLQADRTDAGYPKPIDDQTWPGVGPYARLIIGACNWANGKAYFFLSNGQYLRYDIQQDKVDPGYPKPINDANWPGIGRYAGALSSTLPWKDGKIQFFLTNGQYLRFDIAKNRVDPGYPQDVTESTWPGLEKYKNLLAGMFTRENGKAYIFLKDGRYIRYDVEADKADEGYPKAIDDATWPGMGAALGRR